MKIFLKIVVGIEFLLLKGLYLMLMWNWFMYEQLFNYEMTYIHALSILFVVKALTFKLNPAEDAEWAAPPEWWLFATPFLFMTLIFIAWIFKLILI